jgi:hypothetical protein
MLCEHIENFVWEHQNLHPFPKEKNQPLGVHGTISVSGDFVHLKLLPTLVTPRHMQLGQNNTYNKHLYVDNVVGLNIVVTRPPEYMCFGTFTTAIKRPCS